MIKCTNRRSISSIIGGAIFLVLFIAGFTVFMFAIQVSSDRFSEQLSSSFEDTLRGKETFSIAPTIDNSGKLFVEVFNKGPNPLNVQQVFIANVTAGGISAFDVAFQDSHVAPNERKNVLANHPDNPINITSTGPYDAKVVTEQGTMVTLGFASPLNGLFADIFTIPKNPGSGQNVTIALFVYNRGNSTVFELSPFNSPTAMTVPVTAIQGTTFGPNPASVSSLEPQESAFFTWEQQVVGAIGTQIQYTNFARGTDGASGDTLDSNSDTSTVQFVPQAISQIQRPDIRFLIPSPSGREASGINALWGLNAVNPTSFAIDVSRIIFTSTPNSGAVEIFSKNCSTVNIEPPTGTWTCPADNVLMWENIAIPEVIGPKSAKAFTVLVVPGTTTAGFDDPGTLITGTVYSSYGPATQIGVPSGMIFNTGDGSIVNIFVTNQTSGIIDTSLDPDALEPEFVLGNLQNIASGSTFSLNMTLAVLSDNANAGMQSGGRIVINIPAGFKVGAITDINGAFVSLTSTEFSDGSNQVTGKLTNTLGASSTAEAVTVKIILTAPIVTIDALYTIFGLAEGVTEVAAHPIGPIVEFPLQVNKAT